MNVMVASDSVSSKAKNLRLFQNAALEELTERLTASVLHLVIKVLECAIYKACFWQLGRFLQPGLADDCSVSEFDEIGASQTSNLCGHRICFADSSAFALVESDDFVSDQNEIPVLIVQ
jgi:hypothetical protein